MAAIVLIEAGQRSHPSEENEWTDEVTQAGTVAMLEPRSVLASRGADHRSRVEGVPHTFIDAV